MHSLAQMLDPAAWFATFIARLGRYRPGRILARGRQDHLDQYSAFRRQRRGHRHGLPRPAVPAAVLGHDPRRRRRGVAAHRVHRRGRLADAAALSQDRRRAGAVLHRRQAAGSRRSGRERNRSGRASLARGAHGRRRRHHHEPRQRHRHRGRGRRQHGAARAGARHQHSADRGGRCLDHGAARPLPDFDLGGRCAAGLDCRRGRGHRPGGNRVSHPHLWCSGCPHCGIRVGRGRRGAGADRRRTVAAEQGDG